MYFVVYILLLREMNKEDEVLFDLNNKMEKNCANCKRFLKIASGVLYFPILFSYSICIEFRSLSVLFSYTLSKLSNR